MKKLLLGLALLALPVVVPASADDVKPAWSPGYGWSAPFAQPPVIIGSPALPPVTPLPASALSTILKTNRMPTPPAGVLPPIAPAKAPVEIPPMHVIIVHSSATDCGDHCADWISAEGKILSGTPALFRKALKAMGSRKLAVFISSGGGDVNASLAIGRMIRARGLDVVVSKTTLTPCAADDKKCSDTQVSGRTGAPLSMLAYCASACTDILAAGTRRLVALYYTGVGLHEAISMHSWRWVEKIPERNPFGQFTGYRTKITSGPSWQEAAGSGQYKTFAAYFKEMGIKGDIIGMMHSATPEDMHWLTAQELSDTSLATERMSSEVYVAAINHPPGVSVEPAPHTPPAQPVAPLVTVLQPTPQPVPAHPADIVITHDAVPLLTAAAAPAPAPVHSVQTEVTHTPAESLPLLKAPIDSSTSGPFTEFPVGGSATAPQSKPIEIPAVSAPQVAALVPAAIPDTKSDKPRTAEAKTAEPKTAEKKMAEKKTPTTLSTPRDPPAKKPAST